MLRNACARTSRTYTCLLSTKSSCARQIRALFYLPLVTPIGNNTSVCNIHSMVKGAAKRQRTVAGAAATANAAANQDMAKGLLNFINYSWT